MFKTLTIRFAVFFIGFAVLLQLISLLVAFYMPELDFPLNSLLIVVIGVCVAVVFSIFISNNIVKSLNAMLTVVEALEHGHKPVAVTLDRQDEIGQFSNALNRIVNRDKAVRQANEDPLTGLANRRFLMQEVERSIEKGVHLSLMFLDLDGFKAINDTYGHDMGDEALKIIGERLSHCVRDNDLVCRLGGDEFVLLFNGLEDVKVLETRAGRVLDLINTVIWIGDIRLKMGASIGISLSPKDGKTAEEVLAAADEAMYAAKKGGKNGYKFYS